MDISTITVSQHASTHSALVKMNETGLGLLLVVDESGSLQRTLTDGDLRRATIDKIPHIDEIAHKTPVTITEPCDLNTAQLLMNQHDVEHIPVINKNKIPVDVIRRKDLSPPVLLSTPHMGDCEVDFVKEAFDTNWLAPVGPHINAFEAEFAQMLGVKAACALSSGTAALHTALICLDVMAGDSVFCSDLTFIASANPILYQQATPVFIDSEPETWNMCPKALAKAFASHHQKPKAVIVVNLYGQSANMQAIKAICDAHDVPIIEDAAESLGARYRGQASGTIGTLGFYSFNGNKIITTSGGGMLVSNDDALIKKAKLIANQAKDPMPYYQHSQLGYNYCLSNVLAGIGRGQLQVLDSRVKLRREIFARYQEAFSNDALFEWMPEPEGYYSTRWLSAGVLKQGETSALIKQLAQSQIEARHVWNPMHRQPLYKDYELYSLNPQSPYSTQLFQQGICLPSGSNMSEACQNRVIETIKAIIKTR